jgi:hypothetical protein
LLAYLQYLTSRPRGFLAPTATGGLREGEDPIRLVMCRLADDAAASVISLKFNFNGVDNRGVFRKVGEEGVRRMKSMRCIGGINVKRANSAVVREVDE